LLQYRDWSGTQEAEASLARVANNVAGAVQPGQLLAVGQGLGRRRRIIRPSGFANVPSIGHA
jgi:hypothetical protein